MNEPQDNQLDQLLTDWAESRAVQPDDLDALRVQISERMATESMGGNIERAQVSAGWPHWRAAMALALAATVLVALAAWSAYRAPRSVDDALAEDMVPAVLESGLEDKRHLLAEYREVFGPDFAWLVEQASRAEVGLRSSRPVDSTRSDGYVSVRLALFARAASGSDWKQVQTLNVLARREELVEVNPEADGEAALTMWAYPLDEGMISIDVRYEPSKLAEGTVLPSGLPIESSGVQPLGKSTRIQSFERGGVEYRLYQTAEILDGDTVS